MQQDCLFCKIVQGIIPCASVYQSEHVIAFLDINPSAFGHTLVVPRAHYATLLDVPDEIGTPLIQAMRLVIAALQRATKADGFNVLQNNFSAAGQMIFHTHFHIIPRFEHDGLHHWPSKQYTSTEAMHKMAATITAEINAH